MCGVAGVIAPSASKELRKELAWRLLLNTQIRGRDATGIGFYDANRNPIVVKAAQKAEDFVKLEEFHSAFDEHDPATFILHCRAQTKGDPKQNVNNHPVYSKTTGLMLVHNGRVDDERWRTTYENGSQPYLYQGFDGEVDTEGALRLIETMRYIPRKADLSIDPDQVMNTPKDQWQPLVDWAKAIDDAAFNMGGSYALSIMNVEEPNTVYLLRHTNPTVVAWVPAIKGIVWASTEDILKKSLTHQTKVHGLFPKNDVFEYHLYEMIENELLRLCVHDDKVHWDRYVTRCGMGNPFAFSVGRNGVANAAAAE